MLNYYKKHKAQIYIIASISTAIILLLLGYFYKQFYNKYYWIGFPIMIFQVLIITFIYFETIETRIREKQQSNKQKKHNKAVKKATQKAKFNQYKQLNKKGK